MRRTCSAVLVTALVVAGCGGCPDESGIACVFAGTGALGLGADGQPARQTRLYWAADMEFAPDGTPYLLDWNNHMVRRVTPQGTIETVIGDGLTGDGPPTDSGLVEEYPGLPGRQIRLNHPTDIQFDDEGNLLLAAWHNHKIRIWDPREDRCYTIAGSAPGYAGDGGDMSEARFNQPNSLVRAPDGTMFVLDQRNHRIRRIRPDGTVDTVAGIGTAGYSGDGGPPAEAELRFEAGGNPEPSGGLTRDADGVLYVADGLNHRIRRIDLRANVIETIVGTGEPGFSGDGGPGTSAQIRHPRDLELGPDGRLYFADTENHRVRVWDPTTRVVETVVGSGEEALGDEGVPALEIALRRPMGVAFGPDGVLYVADTENSRFLRIPR